MSISGNTDHTSKVKTNAESKHFKKLESETKIQTNRAIQTRL